MSEGVIQMDHMRQTRRAPFGCACIRPAAILATALLVLSIVLLGAGGAAIAQTVVKVVHLSDQTPWKVGVNPATNKVYVPDVDGFVYVLNGATDTVIKKIPTGSTSIVYGIGVNTSTNRIYISFRNDNDVLVINGTTDTVAAIIPTGTNTYAIGVNPRTNEVYVCLQGDLVAVIDGATNTVKRTIAVAGSPGYLTVNPTANWIYTLNVDNTVSVIDGASDKVVKTFAVGATASGICCNPITNNLYITNTDPELSVFDGSTGELINNISVEDHAIGVCVNPLTNRVYVYADNTVSAIDGSADRLVWNQVIGDPAGMTPWGLAVNQATDKVYAVAEGLVEVGPEYQGGTVTVISDPPAYNFYFAEGTCRPGFDPYICIQNPGNAAASVKITYMTGDGATKKQALNVSAHSRATAHPPDVLGTGDDAAHDFSAKVECTNGQKIIAERPMYFNYKGVWTGGHDAVGSTSPSSTYFFAEGTTRPGFDSYLCIQNPGNEEISIRIYYVPGAGDTKQQDLKIPSHSRVTVNYSDFVGTGDDTAHDISVVVQGFGGSILLPNEQFIVERPMYFNYQGVWTGGSDVVGTTTPASTVYFAEGTCRPNFDSYICLYNPNVNKASVKITYMLGNGTTKVQDVTVATRATVHPADIIGTGEDASHDFSAKVECTNGQTIVAERPMYFNYKGVWTGGHDVIGATSPGFTFDFAEGTCRPNFDTYFCIQNPGSSPAKVHITYMMGDGTTKGQDITVGANSRSTVYCRDTLGTGDDAAHDFSAKVECTNGQRIVAERPMYFNYKGVWTGGHDVVGYQQ